MERVWDLEKSPVLEFLSGEGAWDLWKSLSFQSQT